MECHNHCMTHKVIKSPNKPSKSRDRPVVLTKISYRVQICLPTLGGGGRDGDKDSKKGGKSNFCFQTLDNRKHRTVIPERKVTNTLSPTIAALYGRETVSSLQLKTVECKKKKPVEEIVITVWGGKAARVCGTEQ